MPRQHRAAQALDYRGGGSMVEVRTTEDLARLAKRLRDAGRGDLRKRVLKAMRTETKPVIPAIRSSALRTLPVSGGLMAEIRDSKIGIRTRLSGRSVGVRVVATNPHDIRSLNAGRLRHPLFGDTDHWYQQDVEPGWFDRPLQERAPGIRRAITQALDEAARKLTIRGM